MGFKKVNKILVIIPAFNEQDRICGVIEQIENCCKGEVDILIINDGSNDKTAEILYKYECIGVVNHPYNMGIGASFQTGCKFAKNYGYEYIVRMDGDGQHGPVFINEILKPVVQGKVDIAIGSRFLGNSDFTSSFSRLIGITLIAGLLSIITGKPVTDPTSGFYAMNERAFEFFSEHCVEDYPEPEILIHHRDFLISEVPISISRRGSGFSSITPLKSIYYMYKVLFSIVISCFRT